MHTTGACKIIAHRATVSYYWTVQCRIFALSVLFFNVYYSSNLQRWKTNRLKRSLAVQLFCIRQYCILDTYGNGKSYTTSSPTFWVLEWLHATIPSSRRVTFVPIWSDSGLFFQKLVKGLSPLAERRRRSTVGCILVTCSSGRKEQHINLWSVLLMIKIIVFWHFEPECIHTYIHTWETAWNITAQLPSSSSYRIWHENIIWWS
jgi:hypothetical protein